MTSAITAVRWRGAAFIALCGVSTLLVSLLVSNAHPAGKSIALLAIIPATLFSVDLACLVIALLAPYPDRSDGGEGIDETDQEVRRSTRVPIIVPLLVRGQADIDAAERCLHDNFSLMDARSPHILLLVDFCDSTVPRLETDVELRRSLETMMHCARDARAGTCPVQASVLIRERRWNTHEQLWMGWERKRGKVIEFLRHSRGEPTSFEGDCPPQWRDVEMVFVMDVDSRLVGNDLDRLIDEFDRRRASEGVRPSVISPVIRTLDQEREPLQRWMYEPWVCTGGRDWRRRTLRDQAFGRDIYNGKALIAVDEFLSCSGAIAVNTVLSHDHLEAILGHGCSTPVASVHEPFPASRQGWERRQHRWMRGDFQLLPWLLMRRPHGMAPSLTFGMRAAIAHVVVDAFAPVALYLLMIAGLVANWRSGVLSGLVLLLIHRGGLVLAIARLPLFVADHSRGSWATLRFLCANATLRTLGVLIYIQRDALITADALRLTVGRLARRSRRGLLEWYPSDADRPLRTRRVLEFILLAGSAALWASGVINGAVVAGIIGWVMVPVALGKVGVTRSRLAAPRF